MTIPWCASQLARSSACIAAASGNGIPDAAAAPAPAAKPAAPSARCPLLAAEAVPHGCACVLPLAAADAFRAFGADRGDAAGGVNGAAGPAANAALPRKASGTAVSSCRGYGTATGGKAPPDAAVVLLPPAPLPLLPPCTGTVTTRAASCSSVVDTTSRGTGRGSAMSKRGATQPPRRWPHVPIATAEGPSWPIPSTRARSPGASSCRGLAGCGCCHHAHTEAADAAAARPLLPASSRYAAAASAFRRGRARPPLGPEPDAGEACPPAPDAPAAANATPSSCSCHTLSCSSWASRCRAGAR